MTGISWKRAYAGSAIAHLVIVGIASLFLAGAVINQEQQQMYVVDLDAGELTRAGSGHAGGGSGELFPEKLTEQAVAEKVAQAETNAPSPIADAVPTPAAAGAPSDSSGASAGSGMGGVGSGTGSGTGDGVGDGNGYGEGTGDGYGSGDSGAEGTGSGAFDSEGFWEAVNANKTYPAMAVKRGITGSVGVTATLDADGNCIGASADGGPSILQKAAVNAVYAACPYPNATRQTITISVTVNFNLN